MERLIAAKIAESDNQYETLCATKEWQIVGEVEDDKENTIEALEALVVAKAAERASNNRDVETYNATKQWKLKHKRFS